MFWSPNEIISNAWLIAAIPFIAGMIIILFTHRLAKIGKTLSMLLSVGAVSYAFVHALLILNILFKNPHLIYTQDLPYFISANFTLSLGILVDNLSAMMMLVVTAVSLLVQIYTHGYMREDPGYARFYAYLSLFTASMLGLVLATNLFQTYFFWELVGVCSYFLIGFWWYKNSAAEAALKAFVVNRIGDFLFLIGILMLFAATKDFWGTHTVLAFTSPDGFDLASAIGNALSSHTLTYWGVPGLLCLSLLILCGPIAKSAQFPLHIWLPDAMEGPTPISALIHAATMVAAGVYLIARAYPLWLPPASVHANYGMQTIAWIGGFTAIMAAYFAMSQFDIKRALAWSTVSQLGYMFVGLGAGAFTGGLFHLFNHAFFKAMLFLCSGSVIHGVHGEQDMRRMGGLAKYMPITTGCFWIGTLSIAGVPGLSGFFSKDEIIAAAWSFNKPLAILMILTAAMTAFYMCRMCFMTFHGKYRGEAHPHESPPSMVLPLIVLAVPSILSGYLGFNLSTWFAKGEMSRLLHGHTGTAFANHFGSLVFFQTPRFEGMNGAVAMWSTTAALSGIVLAWLIYRQGALNWNTLIASSCPLIYKASFYKGWIDEIYLALMRIVLAVFNGVWTVLDKWFIDAFLVNGIAWLALAGGKVLRYSENGRGQYYALVIFGWVAVLALAAYFIRP